MRQGWIAVPLAVALLCAAPAFGTGPAHAAPSKSTAAPSASAKKKASLRQFTGWVTALDKTSITVEKRGKAPRTMTFAKHAEMSTTGDVAKDAHVTVYYRDEDGRAVARKVVAKPDNGSSGNGR
jgi:hypothetical protein